MHKPKTKWVAWLSGAIIGAILVLVPLHALLSVWLGTLIGGYEVWRAWKELLLILLVPLGGFLYFRFRDGLTKTGRLIFGLVLSFAIVHLLAGIVALMRGAVVPEAFAYGTVLNGRFLVFFVLCAVVAAALPRLGSSWAKLLFVPAALVALFGLIQVWALPPDALQVVGYGPETIPASQTVDQKQGLVRAQSTLRGPNPLGAYLAVVMAAAAAMLFANISRPKKMLLVGLLGVSGLVLGLTYSRSAYLGAMAALVVVLWLSLKTAQARRWMLTIVVVGTVAFSAGLITFRENDTLQNLFFHTNEYSESARSSNENRAAALKEGLRHVATEPLGRGPGSAGPASVYNDGRVRIAENYYLQIGQEVGWLGLALFGYIVAIVGRELWRLRTTGPLAVALLASLVGISIVNLLSHAWADDTLAYLWWGIAGIALSPAILKLRTKGGSNYERVYKANKKTA